MKQLLSHRTPLALVVASVALACVAIVLVLTVPALRMADVPPAWMRWLDSEYASFHAPPHLPAARIAELARPVNAPQWANLPECHVLSAQASRTAPSRANSQASGQQMASKPVSVPQQRASSARAVPLRDTFRFVIFTDMHFGEDGALDALTQEFQRVVLGADAYDLIVVLGDDASQEDYFWLRQDPAAASEGASDPTKRRGESRNVQQHRAAATESAAGSAAAAGIASCLRDAAMGVRRCWRDAHRAILAAGVPVVTLAGNHDSPPPLRESARRPAAANGGGDVAGTGKAASLAELFSDIHEAAAAASPAGADAILCSPRVDALCVALVESWRQRRAPSLSAPGLSDCFSGVAPEKPAEAGATDRSLPVPPLAELHFFNSVSDETDRVLLHGYKYPSLAQRRQSTAVTAFLSTSGASSVAPAPLRVAFVHVPPPLFLRRDSVVESAGWMNETPGCAPKALDGPNAFARLLVGGGDVATGTTAGEAAGADAGGFDLLLVGHDHKNDEWAVHDRERLRGGFAGSPRAPGDASARPLHLAYSRHSGFGGYFDLQSSRLPGVRVVEIARVDVADLAIWMAPLSAALTTDAARERTLCATLRRLMPDVKVCKLVVRAGSAEAAPSGAQRQQSDQGSFLAVVRSWLLEAIVAREGAPASGDGDGTAAVGEEAVEARVKAAEPAERLLHSRMRGVRVTGLRRDDQVLSADGCVGAAGASRGDRTGWRRSVSRAEQDRARMDGGPPECAGQIDYRVQFQCVVLGAALAAAALGLVAVSGRLRNALAACGASVLGAVASCFAWLRGGRSGSTKRTSPA
jgi:hypothetical protein